MSANIGMTKAEFHCAFAEAFAVVIFIVFWIEYFYQ